MIVLAMGCSSHPNVIVKKKLAVSLSKYKDAYLDVENDAYNTKLERQLGNDSMVVNLEISSVLREININPRGNEKRSDLKVECHFLHGLGIPRLIRHFSLKATYITKVNIKLIDVASGTIIGEVYYKRPFTKTNKQACPEGFIKKMFDELLKTGPTDNPDKDTDKGRLGDVYVFMLFSLKRRQIKV